MRKLMHWSENSLHATGRRKKGKKEGVKICIFVPVCYNSFNAFSIHEVTLQLTTRIARIGPLYSHSPSWSQHLVKIKKIRAHVFLSSFISILRWFFS